MATGRIGRTVRWAVDDGEGEPWAYFRRIWIIRSVFVFGFLHGNVVLQNCSAYTSTHAFRMLTYTPSLRILAKTHIYMVLAIHRGREGGLNMGQPDGRPGHDVGRADESEPDRGKRRIYHYRAVNRRGEGRA